jgi:hypothetical protein
VQVAEILRVLTARTIPYAIALPRAGRGERCGCRAHPSHPALPAIGPPRSTQKPAAHFCGRVSNEAIDYDQNTMDDWTSQPVIKLVLHRSQDRRSEAKSITP